MASAPLRRTGSYLKSTGRYTELDTFGTHDNDEEVEKGKRRKSGTPKSKSRTRAKGRVDTKRKVAAAHDDDDDGDESGSKYSYSGDEADPSIEKVSPKMFKTDQGGKSAKSGEPRKRVLILGKTGNGKSSLGNLILGRDVFTVGKSRMSSCTKDVATEEGFYHDGQRKLNIEVTDTPDVTTDESKRAQLTWLARNVTFDLVLFTVRVDVRYSPEEQQFYKHMKDVFTQALTRNLVVAFTFGDKLDGDVTQFTRIPSLQEVLRDAGDRYVVVNNKAKAKDKSAVVGELLQFCGDDGEPYAGATCDAPTSSCKRDSRSFPVTTHTKERKERKVSKEKEEEEEDEDQRYNCDDEAFEILSPEDEDDDPPLGPNNQSQLSRINLSEYSDEESAAASAPRGPPCVLVIGKTGNGKSSVCNMLLGEKRFKEGRGMSSTTTTAQCEQSNSPGGYSLKVVDTPDISETSPTTKRKEVEKWRQLKPDVILLAIRYDVMYTPEEYNIYRELCKELGNSYVTSRLIVAFTFGDRHDNSVEEEIDFAGKHFKRVLKHADKRYIVFNKNAKAGEINQTLTKLFTHIESIGGVNSAISSMSTMTAQSGQRFNMPLNQTAVSQRSNDRRGRRF